MAATLKYVCAALTGFSSGMQWGGWAALIAVEGPDFLPYDTPAACSPQNPAIYAKYNLTL